MPRITITYQQLFKRLRQLNRVCADDKHYYILLDMRYFHLCVNGEIIYRTSDVEKFFNRLFSEIRRECYPYVPVLID